MKILISFFFTVVFVFKGIGQVSKPNIDSSVYGKWPSISDVNLGNNGKFVLYTIRNQPVGSQTVVIKGTNSNWEFKAPDAFNAALNQDEGIAIFMQSKDKLCMLNLESKSQESIPGVQSYQLVERRTDGREFVVYRPSDESGKLVIRDLRTKQENSFEKVNNYIFNNDGDVLLLHTTSQNDSVETQLVTWNKLSTGESTTIWHSGVGTGYYTLNNFVFDTSGVQVAFKVQNENKYIYHYKVGFDTAVAIPEHNIKGIDSGLVLDEILRFSKDGTRLFVKLKEKELSKANDFINVNVWSYLDSKLQTQQLSELYPKDYISSLNLEQHLIVRLEGQDEKLIFPDVENGTDNIALVIKSNGNIGEENWNISAGASWYIMSTTDGRREQIKEIVGYGYRTISPKGKFVIFYDDQKANYFSFDTQSGKIRNVTKNVRTTWTGYVGSENVYGAKAVRGIAGWGENDEFFLLYDRHDIWEIDPSAIHMPINITNSYGRRHNIVFNLGLFNYDINTLSGNEKFILNAFDQNNKNNGFYITQLRTSKDPELLTMGPYLYCLPQTRIGIHGMKPLKAKNIDVYVVQRMSATQSPNLYSTADFKIFNVVSKIYPEKNYNWYTTALHTFKMLNGQIAHGVLYKPENFDSNKKYPIIFHIYETLSDGLNAFRAPQTSFGDLNIAYFVSNNYLVFEPDIHYEIGAPGKSALNSVAAAVRYISTLPYVDRNKIGIQGHSFGGFEVNYLVTHTDLFAAACSASGLFDFISGYGSLDGETGSSNQSLYETGQCRIGTTIWQRLDLYLKNSPVIYADQVSTPVLIMHGAKDIRAPFGGAIEFFTALRRLGKMGWLLDYEDGNHGLNGKLGDDFTIRMVQFFNHYLMDKPAPLWMTRGIQAREKGLTTGLQLDTKGSCGENCPVCKRPVQGLIRISGYDERKLNEKPTEVMK